MVSQGTTESLYDARRFVRGIQKRALLVALSVGALMAVFWSRSGCYGFLAGSAVSIINFQLMSVDAYTLARRRPRNARKFFFTRGIIRSAIMFGFLALIATQTDYNMIAAFIGVFLVKMVLFIGQIVEGMHPARKASGI